MVTAVPGVMTPATDSHLSVYHQKWLYAIKSVAILAFNKLSASIDQLIEYQKNELGQVLNVGAGVRTVGV